jgi:peptide/nickel transport system permease protein
VSAVPLLGDRRTRAGLVVLGVIALAALAAPLLAGGDGTLADVATRRFIAPFGRTPDGTLHLLGTDRFGRDVLLRLLVAGRISLAVGLLAALVAAAIGVALGAVGGWRGGVVDRALAVLTDAVLAVPRVPLLLLLVALSRPGLALTVLAIGLTGWTTVARLVRADVRRLRGREFVDAARALGVAPVRLLARHVLPHAVGPALVATALGVGHAIMLEAGLSFLGLGVQPPAPSWGNMIAAGRDALVVAPWVALAPAAMVAVVVLATSLVADGMEARLAGGR